MDGVIERVLAYHERTKHRPGRYARSLGYLDWMNQPDPFRRYADAELVPLDEVPPDNKQVAPSIDAIYDPGSVSAAPLARRFLSQLFYDSLALSAWKANGGARWALRCNPSSGNLHPTEGYLIAGPVEGVIREPSVFHYAPVEHALERRLRLDPGIWSKLADGLPTGSVLVGLTSIPWRESWKYGERAFRYCQHDVGHAVAAVSFAAAAQGWQARLIEGVTDARLAMLLGIHGQTGPSAEHPDGLLVLSPHTSGPVELDDWRIPDTVADWLSEATFAGEPNRLSAGHHDWPAIDEVAAASLRTDPGNGSWSGKSAQPGPHEGRSVSAREIIRRRRSAVAMDSVTAISRDCFFRMLGRLLVGPAFPWRPAVHPVFFVHRVKGLSPGLYMLVRDADQLGPLRASMHDSFAWERPPGLPDDLPLFLLQEGDGREAAQEISCRQDIASDGAFAVAMLAEFEPRIREAGPWFYRRLHWEAGALGQILYLEAEAAHVRGTGIGCFFDDEMHALLGMTGARYQSVYHFTVGGPLEDARLQTLPAYHHLRR